MRFVSFRTVEPAPGVDLEGLEVARECLTEVFKLDSSLVDDQIKPNLLVDLFNSLEANEHREAQTDTAHGTILEDAPSLSSAQNNVDAKLSEALNSVVLSLFLMCACFVHQHVTFFTHTLFS